MSHVVLLGDSIFDNASYVAGGPAVIDHLKRLLPGGWKATLAAVDGAMVEHVAAQLARRVPSDATHLVLSIGGNDALSASGLVRFGEAASIADALAQMRQLQTDFQRAYRAMLDELLALQKPLILCTVYDSVPGLEPAEYAGLCLFNDVILREAFRVGADVIDLRAVCQEPDDYAAASPIEPSVQGGWKIADAVARVVSAPREGAAETGSRVFV
ncbi:MAG TPA: SGNH/GDSL hydrolase family protein [Pirellulales bacterium]